MPTYVYRCFHCGSFRELRRPSAERDNPVVCDCEHDMRRVFVPQNFNMKGANSDDPITKFQFEHLWAD